MRNLQAASAVTMIRPHQFYPNSQTSLDNGFQTSVKESDKASLAQTAYQQVTAMADKLRVKGVTVYLFEDKNTLTPDSVFPNNWFSTHSDGRIALYPMFPENRRKERREDIIDSLKSNFNVHEVVDYSAWENDAIFLEGTGAMVLDHIEKIAYAVRSNRANQQALEHFCQEFDYTPFVFDAADTQGIAVYHTNVMMCVGTDFAMIGADMITSKANRERVIEQLRATKKSVIELSHEQIGKFCGNTLELTGENGPLLALSQTAFNALTPTQISTLEQSIELVPFEVSAIETAGGSVRCMLASIHLPTKP